MAITFTVPREIEDRLLANAQAAGVTIDEFVSNLVVRETVLPVPDSPGRQKAEAFLQWAKNHRPTALLSDEAISRAFQYSDRE